MQDVANKLKKLRVSKGISQRELARRVGVSNGTVSMMEQGRTDPTLGLLMKVLEGLDTTVADFFSGPDPQPPQIFFTRDDFVEFGRPGIRYFQPGKNVDGRRIQILREVFAPGASTGPVALTHEGEEAGIILKGRVEITVGDNSRVLGPGDAYYYPSTIPHKFRNVGKEPAELISACTPPF